jgi:hypothetical protein
MRQSFIKIGVDVLAVRVKALAANFFLRIGNFSHRVQYPQKTGYMKRFVFPVLFLFGLHHLDAQHIGINLRIGGEKELELNKKLRAAIGQQFQISPEITDAEDKYSSLFNEIYLFPSDDDDKDDDDNTDDDGQSSDPDNALDDAPKEVEMNFRSATSVRGGYKLLKWLKLNQTYTLNFRVGDLRHSLGSSIEIEKYLIPKKLLTEGRFTFQQTSRKRKSGTEWQRDLVYRFNTEWVFKKNHRLFAATSVNQAMEAGNLNWDRLRLDTGMRYCYDKLHQFSFGYRFQKQLTEKKKSSHGVSLTYEVQF